VVRAIRFKTFGDPSVLEVAEMAVPAIGDAQEAFRKVAAGSAGRIVLRPQE
jgi:hypothetical protein